jgi:hypothetical protein
MNILKMYLKVKYCEVNKENNSPIANSTYKPMLVTKKRTKYAKIVLTALVTQ